MPSRSGTRLPSWSVSVILVVTQPRVVSLSRATVSAPVACTEVSQGWSAVPRVINVRVTQPFLLNTSSTPGPDGVAAAKDGVNRTVSPGEGHCVWSGSVAQAAGTTGGWLMNSSGTVPTRPDQVSLPIVTLLRGPST